MIEVNDVKIILNTDRYVSENNIQTIVDNTVETWQHNRSVKEKTENTRMGKLSEDIVSAYIKKNISHISYISYDSFRTNGFKTHAPFDGLIFNTASNVDILKDITKKINNEVARNKYGKISDKLKFECYSNRIYIVEIKSTKITKRHRNYLGKVDINKILTDDFLEYPKYLRIDKNNAVGTFSEYVDFCKKYMGFSCKNEKTCEIDIRQEERSNMRHIYIRVYIDVDEESAYIVGCIHMQDFIKTAVLKKMKQFDKSEMALYLATSLKNGSSIDNLSKIKSR